MTKPEQTDAPSELRRIRESLDSMAASVRRLTDENAHLRSRLEASQKARADLETQAEHLLHELGVCRREVAKLKSGN